MGNEILKYPGDWLQRKESGTKISVITAYDATMARLVAATAIDAILVGDSLGMVVQGQDSTLPVTLEDMIYHCRLVRRGAPKGFVIADMPFGSYQVDTASGVGNAIRVMKESGVSAVKLEGATDDTLRIIEKLTAAGAPVMGHIGLTPQNYLNLGGFHAQGRDQKVAGRLREQARALQDAGCFAIVLELVVASLADEITGGLSIPTIGIGSGAGTSGQVLVCNDMLGLDDSFQARHVKRYAELASVVREAMGNFHKEIVAGEFPSKKHSFQ